MWFIDNFLALTWLLDLVFKVTLLLSLTLLAERKLANRSAAFKHCLWLACFTGLVALPVASLLLPPCHYHCSQGLNRRYQV